MSMPIVTHNPSSNSNIHHESPNENGKKSRDVSFSSYLDAGEETFVLQLATTKKINSTPNDHHVPNKPEDTEIEVFDAEKYFKDGLHQTSKVPTKTLPKTHRHNIKKNEIFSIKDHPRIQTAPSIRSESSSNSRNALLHYTTAPKTDQPNRKNSFLSSIRCNCYCNDKNAIDTTDDYASKTPSSNTKSREDFVMKQPEMKINSDGHFSFPVFTPKTGNHPKDVFGSPVLENGKRNGSSMERKLSMLTWDAIAPAGGGVAEEIRIPQTSYQDSDSDDSSDLFEIESLSKNNSFLSRQGSDGNLSPRNCYAPSEASIEWSVVTASAADFSVFSDSEELKSEKICVNSKKKEMGKRVPSILSGCKSLRAVRVAGDAHNRVNLEKGFSKNKHTNFRSESFTVPMRRFHDESKKIAGFDAVKRQHSFDARILSQSNSGSSAHILHI